MDYCLTTPSHCLNQIWLLLSGLCGTDLKGISQGVPKLLFCIMSFKVILCYCCHISRGTMCWFNSFVRKVNVGNVNCAQATPFISDSQTEFLEEISKFFRQKITPNLMMTSSNGNIFRVTDHLCGEFTGLRWIPRTKASDAELWCFLWSVSKSTVEKTIVRLVIWDTVGPIMTSL